MLKSNNPLLEENIKIIEAVKDNLIQIKACASISCNHEFSFLDKYLKGKEIVGLGEATHGTKEFQDMRTIIISYMVENLGFRTIILEESYSYCLKINAYILNGEGTAEEAVNEGLCFPWVFKTEETVALIKWMREYNCKADENNKVRFYGMDVQGAEKAIELIDSYIRKVDFESYSMIMEYLECLINKDKNTDAEVLKAMILEIEKFFVSNKNSFIKNSTVREYDEIYHCIEVYKQYLEYDKQRSFNDRDRCMYENVKWIIENEKKYGEGKTIIIGHNDHISKAVSPNMGEDRQLGYWLNKQYKEKYYNIGFEFSKGLFYSWDISSFELKIFEVDKCVKKDLAVRIFEETGVPTFYLDLQTSSQKNLSLKKFIEELNRYYSIGAVYDDKTEDWGIDEIILKDMYNAIFYIKDSNNTTLLNKNLEVK